MDRVLKELNADGLEILGRVRLGSTAVVGDPLVLLQPPGTGAWHGLPIKPGAWHLLGRPWEDDDALLDELVAVHEDALSLFWDLYDDAEAAAGFPLGSGRVALLDGEARTDADLLRELMEPDLEALPWVHDRGLVAAAIPGGAARVYQGRGPEVLLLSVALSPAPRERATNESHVQDRDGES